MLKLEKKIFSVDLLIYVLLFLSVVTFFHYQTPDLSNSIDGSWPITLSTLRHTTQDLGSNIYYTYGPLFERIPIYPVKGDSVAEFFIGIMLVAIVVAGIMYIFKRLMKIVPEKYRLVTKWVLAIFLGFFILAPSSIDSLFFISLMCAVLLARRETSNLRILLAICSVLLFSLYKVSFSVAFIALLPFALMPSKPTAPLVKNRFLTLLLALFIYALTFSLISWNSPIDLFSYLYVGVVNSASYSEFMSLTYSQNFYVVAIYSLLLATAIILSVFTIFQKLAKRDITYSATVEFLLQMFAMFAICFLVYKQAVVRSDDHLLTFIPLLPILLLLTTALTLRLFHVNPKKYMGCVIASSFGFSLVMSIAIYHSIHPTKDLSNYFYNKIDLLYSSIKNNPLNYYSYKTKLNSTTRDIEAEHSTNTTALQDFIHNEGYSNSPITFFGNTTSLAAAFKENTVTHLPFVQNYAAFPPQLFDGLYIEAVRRNPESLLFLEENEPSINERIPAHELSSFFMYISHNYKPVYQDTDKRHYLLQKVSNNLERCTSISELRSTKERPIVIPSLSNSRNHYIKMRVNSRGGLDEKILSLLVKKPVYSINLYSHEGGLLTRRTTPSTLSHGISMNPLYLSYTDIVNDAQFKLAYATISGGLNEVSDITVTFENCSFE